jgi:hypothetical protein
LAQGRSGHRQQTTSPHSTFRNFAEGSMSVLSYLARVIAREMVDNARGEAKPRKF